jgi:hypothetical protein
VSRKGTRPFSSSSEPAPSTHAEETMRAGPGHAGRIRGYPTSWDMLAGWIKSKGPPGVARGGGGTGRYMCVGEGAAPRWIDR